MFMLRNILLGKLGVAIFASLLVGVICISQPARGRYDLSQTVRWIGGGAFFLMLGFVLIGALVLMFWKKN